MCLKFQIDSNKYTRWGGVEAQIYTGNKGLFIAVTYLRIHTGVACERKQVAAGNIETCLSEWNVRQHFLEVITQRNVLDSYKITIFNIEIRYIHTVDTVTGSQTRQLIGSAFTCPASQNLGSIIVELIVCM